MKEDGLKGPLTKFFSEADLQLIVERCELEVGDAVFFGAGEKKLVLDYMGRVRIYLAQTMAEVFGSRQADLLRGLSERMDGLGHRIGQSMTETTRNTHENLAKLNERLAVIDTSYNFV